MTRGRHQEGPPRATTVLGSTGDEAAFLSIPAITLRWVLRLRWGAVAGQTGTIAAAVLALGMKLPLLPVAAIIAFTAVTNLAIGRWMRAPREVSPLLVAAVLGTDVVSLAGLLYFTGGPSNPFSVLFLVEITIAALVLGARYAAAVVAVSAGSYAVLFFDNVPLSGMEHAHHTGTAAFSLHLQGMFVAFTLAAVLIAYFVTRMSGLLREREAQLAAAQRAAATNERLASLSTLAAGAAHELGTPLATIAVASKELERAAQQAENDALLDDARLIRQQVDRCRDIVQHMSARAAGALGEAIERVAVDDIVRELRARLEADTRARLDVHTRGASEIAVPFRALTQTLVSLVRNAFDATTSPSARVALAIEVMQGGNVTFTVLDEGHGIAPEQLAHVGEPFFTTKPPGAGMGLGVFLARSFAERLGGSLALDSTVGKGTKAVLLLRTEGGS